MMEENGRGTGFRPVFFAKFHVIPKRINEEIRI